MTQSDDSFGWPDPDVEHNIHGFREEYQGADCRIRLRDPKGGDWDEWPEDLRVRQFPQAYDNSNACLHGALNGDGMRQ